MSMKDPSALKGLLASVLSRLIPLLLSRPPMEPQSPLPITIGEGLGASVAKEGTGLGRAAGPGESARNGAFLPPGFGVEVRSCFLREGSWKGDLFLLDESRNILASLTGVTVPITAMASSRLRFMEVSMSPGSEQKEILSVMGGAVDSGILVSVDSGTLVLMSAGSMVSVSVDSGILVAVSAELGILVSV